MFKERRIVQTNQYGFKRVEFWHDRISGYKIKSRFLEGEFFMPESHAEEFFTKTDLARGYAFVSIDTLYVWQETIDAWEILRNGN